MITEPISEKTISEPAAIHAAAMAGGYDIWSLHVVEVPAGALPHHEGVTFWVALYTRPHWEGGVPKAWKKISEGDYRVAVDEILRWNDGPQHEGATPFLDDQRRQLCR